MSYPLYLLICFIYILAGRYIMERFFPYQKLNIRSKIISLLAVLGTMAGLLYLGIIYIPTQIFPREGLAKGIITRFSKGGKAGTIYEYKYTLDRVYVGGGNQPDENLRIGDTIDVIYDKDDIPMPNSFGYGPEPGSYLAYTRYKHILGDWCVHGKYKKYLDKIQNSKNSKSKYLGELP